MAYPPNSAPGGSSDPMARNSERVRSTPQKATTYDPPQTIALDWAARQSVQFYNADKGSAAKYAAEWALGQVSEWENHINRDQSLAEKIDFLGWLNGSAKSFFEQLDKQRGIKTKDAIKESDRRYRKEMEPGYQTPGPHINGEEDQKAIGGQLDPATLDPDERTLNTFCAQRSWLPEVVEFARKELAMFRAYRKRFRTELTFKDWLAANPPTRRGRAF